MNLESVFGLNISAVCINFRWKNPRRRQGSESDPHESDFASQYSFCSCSICGCHDDCLSQCRYAVVKL